jgi:hypothetical protein
MGNKRFNFASGICLICETSIQGFKKMKVLLLTNPLILNIIWLVLCLILAFLLIIWFMIDDILNLEDKVNAKDH